MKYKSDMSDVQAEEPRTRKPIRLWPGVAAVSLQWVVKFVVPVIVPGAIAFATIGGIAGGLLVVIWWLFLSRAPWSERLGALGLMIVAMFAASRLVHESIANGARGMLLPILAIPVLSLALVAGAAASRRLSATPRRATMAGAILLACGLWTLVRTGGFTGDFDNDLRWRWSKTPEQRLLEQAAREPAVPAAAPAPAAAAKIPEQQPEVQPVAKPVVHEPTPDPPAAAAAEWPGFRGPDRDSHMPGVRIETNWTASPPIELWRRPVGPGWSSFAVRGDLVYTQEQRGDNEAVSCYSLTTGKPVWQHRDAARFWESNAGAGPRATPTLAGGRVYTLGATGILNALDARTGAAAWSRNALSDTGMKVPGWGISGSPLVMGDAVIVAVSGALAAYDHATGELRWNAEGRGVSYSSPHLLKIDGVPQIVLMSSTGAVSVAPADGKLLWEHPWEGAPMVQPALMPDGNLLITTSAGAGGAGMRRLALSQGPSGWTATERWTSNGLKPYFSDFVVHGSHAYGFDGSILSCIDIEDGKRKWKGGRYGHGQLFLLPGQDMLLVLSEQGELALVKAEPGQFTEVARIPAIEGKTWNHPVLARDILLVRNGEEMAAFRLPQERR